MDFSTLSPTDALENHFCYSGRGRFSDNPNLFAFSATLRQVMVQHLLDVAKDTNGAEIKSKAAQDRGQ